MARTNLAEGAEAKALINAIHMGSPASDESWVATYGEDRLTIYASAFATPEEAAAQFGKMQARVARGTSRFSAATAGTIAQQAGFRMQDNEENKQVFNFQKGRWVVGIRGIAPDMEAAVFSIEWVDAKK
ncbi:MAG: hypothetical protein R3E12_02210 [Candidatus Eisenbacteria bacterium]|uniref:Uncharacterized protein n=1 Tax=Eiseniibacteriota bacterium TaxID=2212470 RepID=A0A956M0D6_UNCEI|nr:hypothetical protein [Candidatus Eisenbacteria bacterium]